MCESLQEDKLDQKRERLTGEMVYEPRRIRERKGETKEFQWNEETRWITERKKDFVLVQRIGREMDLEQHKSMKRMVKRILRETKMSEEMINKQQGLQKNLREIENDLEEDK